MQTLSSLDEVANNLEQHENSIRIKKLIFCACKNIWENNQDILDGFKFSELIQELCSLNPTIDNLKYSLAEVVKTLNKQTEYSLVANVIVQELEKIYTNSEESTGIIFKQPHQQENKISANYQSTLPQKNEIKSQYNQFDLRQNIMKYTNPLRAKIVLFSVFYNKFNFNEEDWLKLKAYELDSLLQKLFDSCSTIKEIESKLNIAVLALGNSDENIQAASAVIRSMESLYTNISSSLDQGQSLSNYSSDENDNTCQIMMKPIKGQLN
jgi:hypothetical protein